MFSWFFIFALSGVLANVLCGPATCNLTDLKCIEKFGPALYAKLMEADAELGTEKLDPMHHDVIEGNLPNLKYKFTDVTVEGFKDCKIENITVNPTIFGIQEEMICPSLKMYGNYEMNGRLIELPVEGTGTFSIHSMKYQISIDAELKGVDGKDGKSSIAAKNFRLNPKALEPVVFEFNNLFNGQKDLSDAVHKFANENWKEVSNKMQDPVFNASFVKIIKNGNKMLKSFQLEDLFQL